MSNTEEQIRRAMEEGKFDNLPGKGKPLHLEENPLEDPEWRLAHHILRSSGYTLPWIEARRELESAIQAARAALGRTWQWRQDALAENQPVVFVLAVWGQATKIFRQRVDELNKRILSFNLQAPSERFHLRRLDDAREIDEITASAADKRPEITPS